MKEEVANLHPPFSAYNFIFRIYLCVHLTSFVIFIWYKQKSDAHQLTDLGCDGLSQNEYNEKRGQTRSIINANVQF